MSRSPVQIRRGALLEPQALQRKLGGLFVRVGVNKGASLRPLEPFPVYRLEALPALPGSIRGRSDNRTPLELARVHERPT